MIIWCLLLWAWFAQILMVFKNHGTQYRLNYPIVFGALLWGCSKGAHLQMFIYCLLSWAWLAQILQLCRKSWNTQFCNVCVLGWLGPNKSLAHALICFVCTDYISIIDRICFPTHSPKLSQAVLQNVIFQCMVCSVLHIFVCGNQLFSKGERDIGSWLLTIRSGLKQSPGWQA